MNLSTVRHNSIQRTLSSVHARAVHCVQLCTTYTEPFCRHYTDQSVLAVTPS